MCMGETHGRAIVKATLNYPSHLRQSQFRKVHRFNHFDPLAQDTLRHVAINAGCRRLSMAQQHIELLVIVTGAPKRIGYAVPETMEIHLLIDLHAYVADVVVKERGRLTGKEPA